MLAREVLALLHRPASFGVAANQQSFIVQGSSARGIQAGEQFPGPADCLFHKTRPGEGENVAGQTYQAQDEWEQSSVNVYAIIRMLAGVVACIHLVIYPR